VIKPPLKMVKGMQPLIIYPLSLLDYFELFVVESLGEINQEGIFVL
jgi:hypothetical protein